MIMYALFYVYEWTDGQVLSFVKKIRLKCKKGPFTTQACQNAPGGAKTTC